jgi:hypothetical protein
MCSFALPVGYPHSLDRAVRPHAVVLTGCSLPRCDRQRLPLASGPRVRLLVRLPRALSRGAGRGRSAVRCGPTRRVVVGQARGQRVPSRPFRSAVRLGRGRSRCRLRASEVGCEVSRRPHRCSPGATGSCRARIRRSRQSRRCRSRAGADSNATTPVRRRSRASAGVSAAQGSAGYRGHKYPSMMSGFARDRSHGGRNRETGFA